METPENKSKKTFLLFNFIITISSALLISAFLLLVAHNQIEKSLNKTIGQLNQKLSWLSQNKLDQLNNVFKKIIESGNQFTNNSTVKYYVEKVAEADGDITALTRPEQIVNRKSIDKEVAELATSLPLLKDSLKDFVLFSGFKNGRIANLQASPFIASTLMLPPLSLEQKRLAEIAIRDAKVLFSPIKQVSEKLEIDIYLPIFPPSSSKHHNPTGILILNKDVTSEIVEILQPSPLTIPGETSILIQKNGPNISINHKNSKLLSKNSISLPFNNNKLPFAIRASIVNSANQVYSTGFQNPESQISIVKEIDTKAAGMEARQSIQPIYGIAWLGIISTILVTILIWWIAIGFQRKKIAENFRQLANKIDEQQQFIHSINSSIDDFITVKDLAGKYIYTNKAFNIAIGLTPDNILQKTSTEIFPYEAGQTLHQTDKKIIEDRKKITITATLNLQKEEYQFQISKVPYFDKNRNCIGIIEVYRDITEIQAMQMKSNLLHKQTIGALNSTISAIDPNLDGHTRLLSFLAEQIASLLELSENDKVNLIAAANLSQIGKAFIPKDILTKPRQLTKNEFKEVQKHIDHALKILRETEVNEEVLTIIHQIHEKGDGSGYPQHLTTDQINSCAGILGTLNVFAALIQPRAYRQAMSPKNALELLEKEAQIHNENTVRAMRQLLEKEQFQTLLTKYLDKKDR